jgi:exodeoxyribonuclease-3
VASILFALLTASIINADYGTAAPARAVSCGEEGAAVRAVSIETSVTFLSWNIQHGGGTRIPRIVEEISAYDPDVVAVTEYRAAPGAALCAAMKERGLPYCETSNPSGNRNGIAVFCRAPIGLRPCPAPPESQFRWLDIDLPEYGFGAGILHVMAASASAKSPCTVAKIRFWNAVLRNAEARFHEPHLLMGDWNTGAHRLDEVGKTFICSEQFAKLSAMGWTDMWRHQNPGITEYTWYSKFKGGARGNGFRLDHAFATPSLRPRVTSCRYSHVERDAGVTDHSMAIVEID